MKLNRTFQTILTVICLSAIIYFNFHLYGSEFKVKLDPNDNAFQFALVDEAQKIISEVVRGKISPFYLIDSFNERWAEGFPLSMYYAHLPQLVISLMGLMSRVGIYEAFVIIRTLLLIFMPIMFYWGARTLGFSRLQGILVAFFSQIINTDGLYGIDATSYLWRGWGLSSQLIAQFFLPVAFAYALDYLKNRKNLRKALLFSFIVAQSHIGVFYLFLLIFPVNFGLKLWDGLGERPMRLMRQMRLIGDGHFKLLGLLFLTLAYYIVPFFLFGAYRNYSYWDPIWKFDSWGLNQILVWLMQGDIFDFGRLPILTSVVLLGAIWGIGNIGIRNLAKENKLGVLLGTLFFFFLTLFLGRATLGKAIDLLPGFSEYHLHRIILMVQFVGIFVAAWFLGEILKKLGRFGILGILIIIALPLVGYLEEPVVKYAKDNSFFIDRSNKTYDREINDYIKIKETLKKLPKARVYAGKPGNWGRNFTLGETSLYMVLAQDGFPTLGFLPESWSPNSDIEVFFSDDNLASYQLFKVGYLVAPKDITPPNFAKLVMTSGKFNLYQIPQNGWFSFGKSSFQVVAKKTDLLNLQRLWLGSPYFSVPDFPRVIIKGTVVNNVKGIELEMLDLNNYKLNGKEGNIWKNNPLQPDQALIKEDFWIKGREAEHSGGFSVNFKVNKICSDCVLVLKQSFHPNWEVLVNGEKVEAFPVFPFYTAIYIEKAGNYTVKMVYKPSGIKIILLLGGLGILGLLGIRYLKLRK